MNNQEAPQWLVNKLIDVLNEGTYGDIQSMRCIELARREAATIQGQFEEEEDRRVKKNKSFCGCSMCEYHTSAYAVRPTAPTQSDKSSEGASDGS